MGESEHRNELIELLNVAEQFYHDYLLSDQAASAFQYLQDRGFDRGFMYGEQLGYAPKGSALTAEFLRRGYTERVAVETGLVDWGPSADFRHTVHDVFNDRIMIPIRDTHGVLVGFGARVVQEINGQSKYAVSRETSIHKKDETLYGLDKALASAERTGSKELIIADSYTDALMAWQYGINNVVGLCKTNLTPALVAELRRTFDRITVTVNPGKIRRKTPAAAVMLMRCGIIPRVAELPGKDLDETLFEYGYDDVAHRLETSKSLYDFVYAQTTKDLPEHVDVNAAHVVLRQLAPFFNHAESPGQKRLYAEETAKRLGVSPDVVTAYLASHGKQRMIPVDVTGTAPAELEVLANLLQRHAFAHAIEATFTPKDFTNPTYRAIFGYLTSEPVFTELSNGAYDRTDAEMMPLFFKQKILTTQEILAKDASATEAELAQAITMMNQLALYATAEEAILQLRRVHQERDLNDLASRIRGIHLGGKRDNANELLPFLQTYAAKWTAYARVCKEIESFTQPTSPEEPSDIEQPM